MFRRRVSASMLAAFLAATWTVSAPAGILWSDLGATLVHESGAGIDILGGAVKCDNSCSNTLYFKFHVDPLSDVRTEEYFAGFQLYEGDAERLGVGNSQKAWAYSVFNAAESGGLNPVFGDLDLHSSRPELDSQGAFLPYEFPHRGFESTIVFRVRYVPGGDDEVTVWLNPDLTPGATEESQTENLTTKFTANCSYDQIRLRHGGGGGGWTFSDMAIATSFSDFVSAGGSDAAGRGALPLTFRSWQREQGLPQNSVRALAQTKDGYLWIGNDDGITRFDGVRFVSFGMREGLPSGRVRVLLADSAGALWIGTTGGGLTRWQGGRFTTFTLLDGLPGDSITALAEDNEKRLWVGTESGLALVANGRLTNLAVTAEFKGKPIATLLKDRHGILWVGATGTGVFRLVGGKKPLTPGLAPSDGEREKFVRLTEPAVEGLLLDPHCLLEDQGRRIWLGAGDDYVLCRENDQWRRYRIPRHLARPYVSVLAEQPDGSVWAGSVSEGLFQFNEGKLAAVNASSGLSDNFVESELVDREGNLWVGTGAGLNRIRRSNLSAFGQSEGLGYGPVQGLAEVAPGVVWAAKPSDGIYRYEGRSFSRLTPADWSQRYPEVNSLLVAQDGSCWIATGAGLLRFTDAKASVPEAAPPVLTGRAVLALAEGIDGSLWAGTREGELWLGRNGSWVLQTNCPQNHAITAIAPDLDRSLWVGTEGGGLYRLWGKSREHFDKHSSGLLSDSIRTLYLDKQSTLWVGTAGGGLSRWGGGRFTSVTTREGLPDNTISQILEDDVGRLWLGCNRGIACVNKRDVADLAAGKIATLYPQVYGRAEGMQSEECTGGFTPAGLKTKAGLLWFSTLKGITVADPRPHNTSAPAPNVLLEELLVDGVALDSSASVRLPPGKHRLELHYTGMSFRAPDRVRFRYRLEGLDPDWVEAETRRTAFYGYVPPGNYHFHVAACNSEGTWSEGGPSLELTVLRHFWQAWWFLVVAGLCILASVGGTARVLEKRKHQRRLGRLERERAVERERARIAQDLHDDLGSSLTRLSLLSDLLRSDKDNPRLVEAHASKISQSAGQTVRALEEIVWALRPGSDTVQGLVDYIAHFANELFEGDGARCRLDLPRDLRPRPLPPEMRHNIFLIVKEALTNAFKHAAASEVRVLAKAFDNTLEFAVHDNGHGFDLSARQSSGKGHGLGNMRRRADAMGGTLSLQSSPGKGTTVALQVKLPATSETRMTNDDDERIPKAEG